MKDKGLFYLPYYIKPLNVIKQVLVMALAMSSEKTLNYHRELRMFVLNKEQKYLPPKYRVHVYFNTNGQPRFVSDMAIMRIDTGSSSYVSIVRTSCAVFCPISSRACSHDIVCDFGEMPGAKLELAPSSETVGS